MEKISHRAQVVQNERIRTIITAAAVPQWGVGRSGLLWLYLPSSMGSPLSSLVMMNPSAHRMLVCGAPERCWCSRLSSRMAIVKYWDIGMSPSQQASSACSVELSLSQDLTAYSASVSDPWWRCRNCTEMSLTPIWYSKTSRIKYAIELRTLRSLSHTAEAQSSAFLDPYADLVETHSKQIQNVNQNGSPGKQVKSNQ